MNTLEIIEADFPYIKNHWDKPCLFFIGNQILYEDKNLNPNLPFQKTIEKLLLNVEEIFIDEGTIIVSCEINIENPKLQDLGIKISSVKTFLTYAAAAMRQPIFRAYHWLNWHNQSKFCGQCGEQMKANFEATAKECIFCEQSFFPRFSPAVMVLVHKEDKILLARSYRFPPGDYSAIAGFIELGESAEQAAHREVKEEVGIEITNLRYFSSQAWPFPDSFMIAFKADYLSGELILEPDEIEDAKWFSRNDLPNLPPSVSIARELINSFKLNQNQ